MNKGTPLLLFSVDPLAEGIEQLARLSGTLPIVFDTGTLRPLGMAPIFDNNMAFMQGFPWGGACDAYEEARARRVHDLGDFEFDRAALADMPGERIDAMEGIVRRQARCLSVGGQFYSFFRPPVPAAAVAMRDDPTTTALSPAAFDESCRMLDEPVPPATQELQSRKPVWE